MDGLHVSLGHIWAFNVCIPLVGVIFSVCWALIFDFKEAVYAMPMCNVSELLPSVSHATGDFSPQRNVWSTFITVHNGLRFVLASVYYNWYMRMEIGRLEKLYKFLVVIAIGTHLLEVFSLTGLTSIALEENGYWHEKSFVTFAWASEGYMLLSCILITWGHRVSSHPVSSKEKKILHLKTFLFLFNFVAFSMSTKFFFDNAAHCEPYGHTLFAFCEYLTVISNMAFHALASFDFKDYSITILATEDITSGIFQNK